MFRHHVAFRMGSNDKFRPALDDKHAILSRIDVLDDLGLHRFGIDCLMAGGHAKSLQPSEIAFDLLLLATAVMGTDTRIARATNSQDGWTREIHLYVPVSQPELWRSQASLLARMLNFLSGDRWTFSFRARPRAHRAIVPIPKEFNLRDRSCVCLLSGGLDSFIGAVDLLAAGEKPIFVSHYWDGATSVYQQQVLDALVAKFDEDNFDSIRAHLGFPRDSIKEGGEENTQRSRSFLFFAMAAYVASGLGKQTEIKVPENGLISLNVPLDPLRLGSLSTRTAHPFYLARWNELLSNLGIAAALHNPYATKTKGQMVAECAKPKFLKKYAPQTMSCSSPTKGRWTGHGPRHCGHCLPCLIRRASLLHGLGPGVDTTEYGVELNGAVLDSKKAEGEHVRAFKLACSRLKARPNLARIAVCKTGPLIDVMDRFDDYVAVYQDGMAEVGKLLKTADSRPQ